MSTEDLVICWGVETYHDGSDLGVGVEEGDLEHLRRACQYLCSCYRVIIGSWAMVLEELSLSVAWELKLQL